MMMTDKHGNTVAREGVDRCPCGCKYWENDRCVDCGASVRYDLLGAMMAWESGDLDEDDTVVLFQHLVDNGMAWSLQGMYGRQAVALIEAGMVTR